MTGVQTCALPISTWWEAGLGTLGALLDDARVAGSPLQAENWAIRSIMLTFFAIPGIYLF